MDESERQLILEARQGSQWAFEKLISRYDRQVLALALDMVGNREDAQDVYQEALLSTYRGLPRFKMESDFFTWLYRIAVNKALRFRQRRGRREEMVAGSLGQESRHGSNSPEQEMLDAELRAQFDRGLEQLSGQERMAFALCHRQGFKIAQTAELMECSAGAVKSYLFRARGKMKRSLRSYLES